MTIQEFLDVYWPKCEDLGYEEFSLKKHRYEEYTCIILKARSLYQEPARLEGLLHPDVFANSTVSLEDAILKCLKELGVINE